MINCKLSSPRRSILSSKRGVCSSDTFTSYVEAVGKNCHPNCHPIFPDELFSARTSRDRRGEKCRKNRTKWDMVGHSDTVPISLPVRHLGLVPCLRFFDRRAGKSPDHLLLERRRPLLGIERLHGRLAHD